MSRDVQASQAVCYELNRLRKLWGGWETQAAYYTEELLPALQQDPSQANGREERSILHTLRAMATPAEWAELGAIMADLERQTQRAGQIEQVRQLIARQDFAAAERLYETVAAYFPRPAFEELCRQARHAQWVAETRDQITAHLAAYDFAAADDLARQIQSDYPAETYAQDKMRAVTRFQAEQEQRLTDLLAADRFDEADRIYAQIADFYSLHPYEQLRSRHLARYRQAQIDRLHAMLTTFRFEEADQFYTQVAAFYPQADYRHRRDRYYARHEQALLERVHALLAEYKFDEADRLAPSIATRLPPAEYQRLRATREQEYAELKRRDERKQQIRGACREGRFDTADAIFADSPWLDHTEFCALKAPFVRTFMQEQFKVTLSDEQSAVLASVSPTTLVRARAGAGKTGVLIAKAALAIQQEALHPDQVLILAFNKHAAEEIRDRLRTTYGYDEFATARTFHGLAFQVVQPTRRLLSDESGPNSRAHVVREVLWEVWDKQFAEEVVQFFRADIVETDDDQGITGRATNTSRSTVPQVTLRGDSVKSTGEKYIADFLYEHDIQYAYERTYMWDGQTYRPDFTLFLPEDRRVIIEHWAIDPDDRHAHLPEDWDKSAPAYREEMARKRAYWQRQNIELVETSVADLKDGRDRFEGLLRAKLEALGVPCCRLSDEEVQSRMKAKKTDRLTRLFVSFIGRAKQKNLRPKDLVKMTDAVLTDTRHQAFWRMASRVYAAYERHLADHNAMDFEDLLVKAVARIEAEGGCSTFKAGDRHIPLNELRWLLIDEFQDMSPAFFRLITTLRKANPELRVFGVGDDWQAINGFAGSELRFFQDLDALQRDVRIVDMLTNHRSYAAIVELANRFMVGMGPPAKPRSDRNGGQVTVDYLEDVSFDIGPTESADTDYPDRRFRFADNGYDNGFLAARCLKRFQAIVNTGQFEGKTVTILSRNNRLYGVELDDFETKLRALLDRDRRVDLRVSTVHSYKGLQADTVILAGVCEGTFPIIHPDTLLFQPLAPPGENVLDSAMAEEKRLFYVALTRAVESLWILTEKQRKSRFLKSLST